MKVITRWLAGGMASVLATFACPPSALAQAGDAPWFYTLIDGSQLLDDCPICDRLSLPIPLWGTFQSRLLAQGPLFSNYAIDNLSLHASSPWGVTYHVTGQGSYQVGGEVAVRQSLALTLLIDDGVNPVLGYYTNDSSVVTRGWPMMQISITQTNGTPARVFHLGINAAPFREIWFSTMQPFTAGLGNPPTNAMSAGDLLSSLGRVVKRNSQLSGRLGIQPLVPDLGLKDIGILPGGEIAFSITQDILSETLGELHPGDLLTDRGRVLHRNADLLSPFAPSPVSVAGAGLGALKLADDGSVTFSVQTNFYSKTLGRTVQTGDLLSNTGSVVRSEAQLLGNFSPSKPSTDYGVSAVFLWPGGETWFSTTRGFTGPGTNAYAAGDLLSDQGYVVFRSADLLSAFQPGAGVASLGLDALYVVTDVPTSVAGPGPAKLALPQPTDLPPTSLLLQWTAAGRVFQLERAASPAGPYVPAAGINTDLSFIDPGVLSNQAQWFYRLRQW